MIYAAAPYQNVFGDPWPLWVPIIGTALMLSSVAAPIFFSRCKGTAQKALLIGAGGIALIAGLTALLGALQSPLPWMTHEQANIQQKFGATSVAGATLEDPAKPHTYTLHFADGTKGDYVIRFDRQTSEPIVTNATAPSAQQLEQSASH